MTPGGVFVAVVVLLAVSSGPCHAAMTQTYVKQLYSTLTGAARRAGDLVTLEDGSTLVFRATAGKGGSVWSRYISVGRHDDGPLDRMTIPNGCLTVDNLNYCDRHYRSEVLDFWPSDDIDTVRLGVYKNGVEVQFAEFNGTGSNYKNWMSKSRLLSSSWTDLKTNPNNFLSLEGDGQNSRWRRVFISRNYAGCAADRGWLVALSRWDECDWTKNIGPYPAFLFSRKSTHAVWNTKGDVDTADVLAVTIKFKHNPTFRPSA